MDWLRSILMLYGVVLHATTIADAFVFDAIAYISHLCRVQTFFVASGFLTALTVLKYGLGPAVKKRLLLIGLPLTVTLITLNPITNFLLYVYHNQPLSLWAYLSERPSGAGPMVWHLHLWFLFSLLAYAATIPLLRHWRLPRLPFGVMAAGVVAACFVFRVGYELTLDAVIGAGPFAYIVKGTLQFWPFYAFGYLMFSNRAVLDDFSRIRPTHVVLATAGLLAAHGIEAPHRAHETMKFIAENYATFVLASVLFRGSKFMDYPSSRYRYLSESVYSIYLFQYFAIAVTALAMRNLIDNIYLLYVAVVVCSYLLCFAAHHFLVLRSKMLRLAFNGKVPLKRPSERAGAD